MPQPDPEVVELSNFHAAVPPESIPELMQVLGKYGVEDKVKVDGRDPYNPQLVTWGVLRSSGTPIAVITPSNLYDFALGINPADGDRATRFLQMCGRSLLHNTTAKGFFVTDEIGMIAGLRAHKAPQMHQFFNEGWRPGIGPRYREFFNLVFDNLYQI